MSIFGDCYTMTKPTSTSTANVTLESLARTMKEIRDKLGDDPAPTEYYLTPNPWMVDHKQVRFPRSKAFRIRKKWRKNLDNWTNVPQKIAYKVGNRIVAHPVIIEKMKIVRQLKAASTAPNIGMGERGEGK